MKNLMLLTTLFVSLFAIVNCAPNRSSSNSNGAQATVSGACPSGYYFSNGQCVNGNGQYIPANGSYNLGFYADNYSGTASLQIVNATLMKQLYKYGMGVCDLASNNYGQSNCDSYIRGETTLIIQMPNTGSLPNSAVVTIFAKPFVDPYFNYYGSSGPWWQVLAGVVGIYLPDPNYYSGAYRNPLQTQMGVAPINNNQGFQISGYGDYWTGYNRTLITVEVTSGTINSNSLNYNLKIGGQVAATGRLTRCQTLNCGI